MLRNEVDDDDIKDDDFISPISALIVCNLFRQLADINYQRMLSSPSPTLFPFSPLIRIRIMMRVMASVMTR